MRLFASTLATVAIGFLPAQQASAEGAPWGCEILLCAASSNPSWHSVPYCVPPMKKLITAMAKPGFQWPICPGAGTGKPGHEPYDDCPAGYEPAKRLNDRQMIGGNEICRSKAPVCKGRGNDRVCDLDEINRPRKENPYYFDIQNGEGKAERHWFNLNY